MPPRKSNASVGSVGPEDGTEATPSKEKKDGVSVEDLSLPKSMVARLAKGVLPANTQIHKDALLALHKSASVFVSYIASNANENAQSSGKKTISPQDVMAAMKDCEFEDFQPRLEAELKKYNEVQCDKRNTYRRKVKEEKAAQIVPPEEDISMSKESETTEVINGSVNGHDELDDDERPTKKFKADDGSAMLPEADGLDDDEMDGEQDNEPDPNDQFDDDDDEEDEGDEVDDDEEGEQDGGTSLIDDHEPEVPLPTMHMRDEALDEPGSDSD